MGLLHLLEPEETIGKLWHRLVGSGSSLPRYPDDAVTFGDVSGRLRVFFRGLGGEPGVDLKPAVAEISHHRLNRRLRLGVRAERVARARFNGERFTLPDVIDIFPDRSLNEALYFWLAAWTVIGGREPPMLPDDPLMRDVSRISHAERTTETVLKTFPGLIRPYENLQQATLALRPKHSLPPAEACIESMIRDHLAQSPLRARSERAAPFAAADAKFAWAPARYQTYLPVLLWGEIDNGALLSRDMGGDDVPGTGRKAAGDGKSRRGWRRSSDQINRKGGFFVHRFEKILTWTEFMNLHRDVEDDEEESARKAADDHEEMGVGRLEKKAATRLAIDLDLAPADVDCEALSDTHTYPEWDYRRAAYLPDHVRVLERAGEVAAPESGWQPDPKVARRIRAVRRQFEALRPRRELLGRQLDGHELDIDEVIRSTADMQARGEGSDRVFRQAREQARDLSVAVLIDVSRSSESYVDDRPVIDIAREALVALTEGLDACGDAAAIFAFSSLKRDRVFVTKLKDFQDATGPLIRARIAALRPGFYTRLGAAIRHVSTVLGKQSTRKRLLIVLTDGKPNDLDHYEGRYGVEDTRKAILEARRSGQSVFGITIDNKAQSYFPHIFGSGGFAILNRPARLTSALPVLYRHLVS